MENGWVEKTLILPIPCKFRSTVALLSPDEHRSAGQFAKDRKCCAHRHEVVRTGKNFQMYGATTQVCRADRD